MEIKFVSVVSESVASIFRDVCVELEGFFEPMFRGHDFGGKINEFIFAIVAVDSNREENEKFCLQHNDVGKYKHWLSHEVLKFISLAVPVDPEEVEGMQVTQASKLVCHMLLACLDNPGVKIPRDFNYPEFSKKVRDVVDAYRVRQGQV